MKHCLLNTRMHSVSVKQHANGTFTIDPHWKPHRRRRFIDRKLAAYEIEVILNGLLNAMNHPPASTP